MVRIKRRERFQSEKDQMERNRYPHNSEHSHRCEYIQCRSTAIIVIRRYAWMRPIQTMGFCCMKPNGPIPIIRPMVVAAAFPDATSVKIVP
jgi:hypothetical protein